MATGHTHGEWSAYEEGINIHGDDGMHEVHCLTNSGQLVMICQLGEGFFSEDGKENYHLTMDEALENAKLIASAPLLKAENAELKNLLSIIHEHANKAPYKNFDKDFALSRIFYLSSPRQNHV